MSKLQKLLPSGPISVYPDYEGADVNEDEWVVGVALRSIGGHPMPWKQRRPPIVSRPIAVVRGRKLAVALAELLMAARDGSKA